MKQILFIISQGPNIDFRSQEVLDTIFFAASYDFCVSIVFCHKGIDYLLATECISTTIKSVQAQIQAFAEFGIKKIYVCGHDKLELDRILSHNTNIAYKQINENELVDIIETYDIVIYDSMP